MLPLAASRVPSSAAIHRDRLDFPDDIPKLRDRSVTPGAFSIASCDSKFTDEDLGDEGNAFAAAYFDLQKGKYIADYEAIFGKDGPTIYHVTDSWENYDRIAPVMDDRLMAWRQRRLTDDLAGNAMLRLAGFGHGP